MIRLTSEFATLPEDLLFSAIEVEDTESLLADKAIAPFLNDTVMVFKSDFTNDIDLLYGLVGDSTFCLGKIADGYDLIKVPVLHHTTSKEHFAVRYADWMEQKNVN